MRDPPFHQSVHACIDRVPVPELFGPVALLIALLRDLQDCVEHLQIVERQVTELAW